MSLITKFKIYAGTIVLLVVAGLGYGAFDRNLDNPLRGRFDDAELVLYVSYNPNMSRPILSVQLSGTLPVAYSATKNPWERSIKVPVATRIILSVMQGSGGLTECKILRDGVVKSHDDMYGPGNISCQYLVE
jgi:hypothetical protein